MKILYVLASDEESVAADSNYYRTTLKEAQEKQLFIMNSDGVRLGIFKVTIEEVPE